jgi:catechol 2,3-dioxygenase-like lactoylglutathione lyase family enzyme
MGGYDAVLIFDRLVLDVEQLDRALQFYTQALDFHVVTTGDWLGHRTALMQLGALHVLLLEQPGTANPLQLPKSGPVITLSDARIEDRLYAVQSLGVELLSPLAESPWGGRSFLIRDPDNYLIVIQEPGGDREDER